MSWVMTLDFTSGRRLVIEDIPTFNAALRDAKQRMLTSGYNIINLQLEMIDTIFASSAFDEVEYLDEQLDNKLADPDS